MFFGKPSVLGCGKEGFPVFISSLFLSLSLATLIVFVGRPVSAFTVSAGTVAYEIYGVTGAHEVVHGQFISTGWDIGGDTTFGFVYEYGLAYSGIGAQFADYGVVFEHDLRKGVGMGIRMSQATARAGGIIAFREPIFGVHGRIAIKQLETASLGIMAGFVFAPHTPNGAEVSPRIALVGTR